MSPLLSYEIFAAQPVGGISRYFVELHQALLRRGVDSLVLAGLHRSSLLEGVPRVWGRRATRVIAQRSIAYAVCSLSGRALEAIAVPAFRRRHTDAVLHRSYFPAFRDTNGPVAVTVADMIHERHPELFRQDDLAQRKLAWCKRADVVFAISQTTRDDLLEHFAIDAERVIVTPLGVAPVEPDAVTLQRLSARDPFLLYVGKRGGYKNFELVLVGLSRLSRAERLQVIAFGGGAPTEDERSRLAHYGLADAIEFTGGDDESLAAHYATATALIYPSLDEGFGLPPLEAMAHDCPAIVSSIPAVRETCSEAAVYFDPTDADSMLAAVSEVTSGSPAAVAAAANARSRWPRYSWSACASATLKGYEQALAGHRER